MMYLTVFTVVLLVGRTGAQQDPVDQSLATEPEADYIKTLSLPGGPQTTTKDDEQLMMTYNPDELPELSSGVVGTIVYNDSIYMAGQYRSSSFNGRNLATRVRIPNYAMFRISRTDEVADVPMKRSFYFNVSKALWEESIDTPNYFIRSIMGVHAYYSRTFFHAIRVVKKQPSPTQSVRTFSLSNYHANSLADQKFKDDVQIVANNRNAFERLPDTTGADGFLRNFNVLGAVDGSDSEIVVFSNGPQAGASSAITNMQVTFKRDQTIAENLYLQTVAPGKERASAMEEYKTAQTSIIDFNAFLNLHTQAWEKRFRGGNIEVQGRGDTYARMRRLIKSSLYQVYSQFPFAERYGNTPAVSSVSEDTQFFGVSATGLGRGGSDFGGHVTPEQELYVFDPVTMFHPDLGRQILFYRTRQLHSNNPPVPFEAARSGASVEPFWCQHCQQQALYPTGLLGLAVRHYHAITRDDTWVNLAQRGGFDTLDKIARFFDGKIQKNTTRSGDYYAITGVCGPDELHQSQTNNLFTNTLAALSVHYWSYLRCLGNKPRDANADGQLDRARRLGFPYNSAKGENEQFEGYDAANQRTAISQADALLAYFPVAFNMSGKWLEITNARNLVNDIKKYNRDFESSAEKPTGAPATAMAVKAIAHLQVGTSNELSTGQMVFNNELWMNFASSPFFVWRNLTDRSEAAGHVGSAGAFLQALLFGFGGLRLQPGRLDILRPSLPHSEITALNFRGLHFYGAEFDYSVMADKVRIASVGGSSFKTSMALYDRVNRKYIQFSGTAEQPIPAQPVLKANEVASTAAVYSLIAIDSSKTTCRLEDQNHRSHNPYFQNSGFSTIRSAPASFVCLLAATIAFVRSM